MSVFSVVRRRESGESILGLAVYVVIVVAMFVVGFFVLNVVNEKAQERVSEIKEVAGGEGLALSVLFGSPSEEGVLENGFRVLEASKVGCLAAEEGSAVRCVDTVVEFLEGNEFGAPAGVLEGRVVVEDQGKGFRRYGALWLVPNGMGAVGEGTGSVELDGAGLYEVLSDDETLGLSEVRVLERDRLLGLKVDLFDEELGRLEGFK